MNNEQRQAVYEKCEKAGLLGYECAIQSAVLLDERLSNEAQNEGARWISPIDVVPDALETKELHSGSNSNASIVGCRVCSQTVRITHATERGESVFKIQTEFPIDCLAYRED